ncbi:hypothetical protein NCC49_004550 [Naganishia albida]|nr:hypothetical protein NCC49_004550 [Naganishia albida]
MRRFGGWPKWKKNVDFNAMIEPLLVAFLQEFDEDILKTEPAGAWVNDPILLYKWRLSSESFGVFARLLWGVGSFCQESSTVDNWDLSATPHPMLPMVLQKRIAQYGKKTWRAVRNMKRAAHDLAPGESIAATDHTEGMVARSRYCCGPDEEDPYRWKSSWTKGDALATEPKYLKPDLPEYDLFHLGTEKLSYGYDPALRARVGNASRYLLEHILRLTPNEMEKVLGTLD